MNPGNSKSSDPHRLIINILGKINLKRSGKHVALSNLLLYQSIYYTWKSIKKS